MVLYSEMHSGKEKVMRRRITAAALIFFFVSGLLTCCMGNTVLADTEPSGNTFSGDVELLKQDNGNYVMQVTVENRGEDFTGTVQAIFGSSEYANCAYNTEITLPAQGKKQFTVTVTKRAIDPVRGLCMLNFIDEKGRVLQSVSLKNVLGNSITGISVGILSDHYSELTFMDAGGMDVSVRDMTYPLDLIELDADNLSVYLDGLYFLIIDQFNVSSLGEEQIRAIEEWVNNGGWLIIGTGEYAEQTLSGFDEDFLDIEIYGISEPDDDNIASLNADRYGYYYNYIYAGVDFTQMAAAELNESGGYFWDSSEHPAITGSIGEGAATVFFSSLGEKEFQKLDDYVIGSIYDELMYASNSYYSYSGYADMEYVGMRLLAFIDDCNTSVDFTWLEVLIGFYVVLIGPVLYLILRKIRKNEWYWVCVPALGFVFIAGVYFFGQDARVKETRVYSVTAQRVDSTQAETYFMAYHSGVKEWNVRLNDSYEVAGPGWEGYYGGYTSSINDYYYTVSNDAEGLSIGIKPQENFESGFLYASAKTQSKGTLASDGANIDSWNAGGTVTNDTAYDMAYLAVMSESYIMVFSDVNAGETIDLGQAMLGGRCVYQNNYSYYGDLSYDMVGVYGYRGNYTYERDDMAALLIGIGIAEEAKPADERAAVIVGVVKDYDKAAAGKCNETSYGCLYSYAELEVE